MKIDIKSLTLEEKLKLLCARDGWYTNDLDGKIDNVRVSDGPSGLRMNISGDSIEEYKATSMPCEVNIANTWNTDLAYDDGQVIADECVEMKTDILLAPGVNIKRTPLCGRNFEYYSEDPLLAGLMAKAFIEGVQDKGIGTSLKHFCLNNREFDRCNQTSEVDERTLREIYLKPFEIALKAKPWTVMCSYNPINGMYASENKKLLKDTLRDKLGFDGLIMSDWGAVHNSWRQIKATCDIEMPFRKNSLSDLKSAYDKGLISDDEIDFCVNNIINLIEKSKSAKRKVEFSKAERHQKAVDILTESIVLLKNEDNILPLTTGKVGVIGWRTKLPVMGGGGSSNVKTEFVQKGLEEYLNEYSKGAKFEVVPETVEFVWGNNRKFDLKKAYESDAIIYVVGGAEEREGRDRETLKISNYEKGRILQIADINKNVVVVIEAGSAIDVSDWVDSVKAVVFAGFGGEAVNEAIASILTGKAVPSGKLSETFPLSLDDTALKDFTGRGISEFYKESVFVGYRYYDKNKMAVRYPFGFGLSYANFEYSDLKINKKSETDYQVSYLVKNNSDFDAKEVSQVYVKDVFAIVERPEKELVAFSKDLIKAHSTKKVCVNLNYNSFAYFNASLDKWHVENGVFEIMVGTSSRDIKLNDKITINLPEETQISDGISDIL